MQITCLTLWTEESEWVKMQNPIITFPTRKRISTELFVEKAEALYKADGRINDESLVQWFVLVNLGSAKA